MKSRLSQPSARALRTLLLAALCVWALSGPGWAQADPPAKTDPLDLNSATGCMEGLYAPDQPEAERTVPAEAVLESLRLGHCLRLEHARVSGELDLTRLPLNGVSDRGGALIQIKGAFVLRDSTLSGPLHAGRGDNGPALRFNGPVVFSGSALAEADFTGAQFARDAYFDGASFAGALRADGARFERDASWANARVEAAASWTGVAVAGRLDARGATFADALQADGLQVDGALLLGGAAFRGELNAASWDVETVRAPGARFGGPVTLSKARVRARATFEDARFGDALRAENAHFEGSAHFAGATFAGPVTFGATRFDDAADFSGTAFERGVSLPDARFGAIARFSEAAFGGTADFSGARFAGWADFSGATFADLSLERAAFLNPIGPHWTGATFGGELRLAGAYSVGPWHIEPAQLAESVSNETHPFLPRRAAPDPTPWLLGATTAGVGLILLLLLLK